MDIAAATGDIKTQKTVKKLTKKYAHTRTVNDKVLKPRTLWQGVFTIFANIFFGLVVLMSGLFCFNIINNKYQNTPPAFLGYSAMRIVSGSMMPDFAVGDAIMVHSVKTHTLNVGDNIAFYVYNDQGIVATKVMTSVEKDHTTPQYNLTFNLFIGVQTPEIRMASRSGAAVVFHKIVEIYEDQDGVWWFKAGENAFRVIPFEKPLCGFIVEFADGQDKQALNFAEDVDQYPIQNFETVDDLIKQIMIDIGIEYG